MIEFVMVKRSQAKRSWFRRTERVSLRKLARAISLLQAAEGMSLHAQRDGCLVHAVGADVIRDRCLRLIPRRLLADSEWVHQHIQAPGMRIQARLDDAKSAA